MRHLLPCGGEDLAAVRGDIRLTRAEGGESFVPLGAAGATPPGLGEVIYRDDAGVLCRCWNWREAERTKLTATPSDAVLVLERMAPLELTRLEAALDELAALVRQHLGGQASVTVLDGRTGSIALDG